MIKNKLKLGSLALVVLLALGVTSQASASSLVWTNDQTVDLSAPDINLTVLTSSGATSLIVGTGSVQASVTTGDVLYIRSEAAAYGLAVTGNTTATLSSNCSSDKNTVVITGGSGPETVTITPSTSNACSGGGRGGGGGGGGGGGSSAPKATPAAPGCTAGYLFSPITGSPCGATVGNSNTTPAAPALNAPGQVKKTYAFGVVLVKQGTRGDACKAWQNFLNDKKAAGLVVDGVCGKKTATAAKAWQLSVGLKADGLLGAMSRAKAAMQ